MGWWWNQSAQPRAQSSPDQSTADSSPALTPSTTATSNDSKPLTRDELADQELTNWLQALSQPPTPPPNPLTPKPPLNPSSPSPSSPDSLYPTTLSCQSAFNYAMRCQSLGGQFTNVYRYGTWRSCSDHWAEFWFCMRTRQWERSAREDAVADHYRRKAVKYKTGPSSEDVWRGRRERVQEGDGVFRGDYEGLERRWREWKSGNPGEKEEWEV